MAAWRLGVAEPWPIRLLGTLVDLAVTVAGALIIALVFGNVVARAGFDVDIAWSNEVVTFLLLWATFLGAAAAARRGAHMRIGELVEATHGRPRAVLEALVLVLVAAVLVLLVRYGWVIVARTWQQETTVLYWPVGLLYAAMPVGAALTLVWVVYDLALIVTGRVRFPRPLGDLA
jgi:TRAP-type C4-dicarboxylate transport system permease small subunit